MWHRFEGYCQIDAAIMACCFHPGVSESLYWVLLRHCSVVETVFTCHVHTSTSQRRQMFFFCFVFYFCFFSVSETAKHMINVCKVSWLATLIGFQCCKKQVLQKGHNTQGEANSHISDWYMYFSGTSQSFPVVSELWPWREWRKTSDRGQITVAHATKYIFPEYPNHLDENIQVSPPGSWD